ncbi:MAG: hypothetical protein M0R48_02665 [Candidatus Omnitrophica bacterium]|jgi:hypothetical protein|nr:hypothetical protein [Candidatus Omnitrophota bacterium]
MRIKNNYIFYILVLCFIFGFSQYSFAQTAQPAKPKAYSGHYQPYYEPTPEITIFYSVKKHSLTQDYEVIITNRGKVIVSENNYYEKPKIHNAKLSDSELNTLCNFIIKTDIFQFKNEYITDKDFIDLDGERLKITIGKRTKEIVISSTSVPPKIRAIINKIEEIRQRTVKPKEDIL